MFAGFKSSLIVLLTLISVVLLPMSTLQGQGTSATVSGTVQDETGGVLPGVYITVDEVDRGTTRSAVTDDAGRYRVPLLEPGTYEIQAELSGFRTAVRTGVKLEVGASAVIDLSLTIGEITERVVVQGEAPLVETTSTAMTGLVDDKKIRDLPLNGRSYEQLALLQTGVSVARFSSTGSANGSGTSFASAGSRPSTNNFIIDGVNISNYKDSTGSAADTNLGVESIREFKVMTSTYSAAYGRNSGAVINVVTQSGTNQWHGSLFEFHRNSALDAKNFFDNPNEDIPAFKRNQFGFSIGGPINQDRTFIFGNYEGLRESLGLTNIAVVPDEDSRQGILPEFDSDGNPTGGTKMVTVADSVKPFLDLYPLPNGRNFGDGSGEFLSGPNQPLDEDYFSIRFDHHFSTEDSIFVRYTFDQAEVINPDNHLFLQENLYSRTQSGVLEYQKVFSPTFINTARFGLNRSFLEDFSDEISTQPPSVFVPGAATMGQIRFGRSQGGQLGLTTLGSPSPGLSPYTSFQYSDDINWTTGSHGIQAGASISRIQNNSITFGTGTLGQYTFRTLEEFLQGFAQQFQADTAESTRRRGQRQTLFGFYIHDDFRYSPNLTFNLGLRWEFLPTISEVNGLEAQLVNLSDSTSTVGLPLFNFTGHQIQPRLGIAWDPFGNGKTAIRAGAGIYHDQMVGSFIILWGSNLFPFTSTATLRAQDPTQGTIPFPNGFDLITPGTTPTLVRVDPDVKTPRKIHFNLNIQQELSSNTMVSVGYVGSRGTWLTRSGDTNTAVPEIREDGSKFWFRPFLPRFNTNFALVLGAHNDVNSFYHSLQMSLRRRFSDNLQFQFSYTYGRSIDDGSNQLGTERNTPQNNTQMDNRKADRGLSSFDIRHNFVANATYDLPFGAGHNWGGSASGVGSALISGWQLSSIVSLATGLPLTIQTGFNRSNNGDFLSPDRPDLLTGANNNPVLGGPDQYFDPSVFVLPEAGTHGDLTRGTVITPGFASVDFSVVKNNRFGESGNVQFRAEFFNILNRPNFGLPEASLFQSNGSRRGTAGRIQSTVNTSRQIQFSLKLMF